MTRKIEPFSDLSKFDEYSRDELLNEIDALRYSLCLAKIELRTYKSSYREMCLLMETRGLAHDETVKHILVEIDKLKAHGKDS